MKYLFVLIITLASIEAYCCGQYEIKASVRLVKGYPELFIYPHTQSEINLKLKFAETPKLSAYIDSNISALVNISSVDGTLGEISKIENIKRIFIDRFVPGEGTSLKLIEFSKCNK